MHLLPDVKDHSCLFTLGYALLKGLKRISYPHVIPNLYDHLSSVEHKIGYFEERWCPNNKQ